MRILERLDNESAREYAYRTLLNNIILLDLEPGSPFTEKDLAAELGLSRTPVREALVELSKMQIVEIFPQRGGRISKIDFDLVEEVQFLRLVLEKAIAEMACGLEERDLTGLKENISLQRFYLEHPNSEKQLELDNQFHRELFALCSKSQIYGVMKSMTVHFDRLRSMSIRGTAASKTVEDHEAILKAVEQRNPREAADLMTRHLSRHRTEQSELRRKYPRYFKENESK